MAQTTVNIRMDEGLKKKFEAFCSDVGLTMSAAICLYANRVVECQEIPFTISNTKRVTIDMDEWQDIQRQLRNAEYLAKIDRSIAQIESGGGTYHELIEVDDDE